MISLPFHVLVFNVPVQAVDGLERRLADSGTSEAVKAEVFPAGATLAGRSAGADAAVIDGRSEAPPIFRLLADIRRLIPRVPIVVTLGSATRVSSPDLMKVGEGLFIAEISIDDDSLLDRIVSGLAAVRPRYEPSTADSEAADREVANLQAVCGPSPLTASASMLDGRPLRETAPDRFAQLIKSYRVLLDRALVLQVRDAEEQGIGLLRALADQLGSMNAGPRDIVDLHRTVIADIVRDQPPQKAKAYIDEGRLVLVQLMGYLASYYRSLTWGGRRVAPARSRP